MLSALGLSILTGTGGASARLFVRPPRFSECCRRKSLQGKDLSTLFFIMTGYDLNFLERI